MTILIWMLFSCSIFILFPEIWLYIDVVSHYIYLEGMWGFSFLKDKPHGLVSQFYPSIWFLFSIILVYFEKRALLFFSCKKQTVDLLFQIPISINELFFHSVSLLNKSLFLKKLVICLSWNMRRLHKTDSFTAYCTFSTNEGHHYCFCLHQHYHLSPIIVSAYILSSWCNRYQLSNMCAIINAAIVIRQWSLLFPYICAHLITLHSSFVHE